MKPAPKVATGPSVGARVAAHATWIIPLLVALGALLVRSSGGLELWVGWGVLAVLGALASVALGVVTLVTLPGRGRIGQIVPAVLGIGFDALLVVGIMAGVAALGAETAKARAEARRKVTASSTTDATADIVDEDYRFRLRWPGNGWKLLSSAEAKRLAPIAEAGAAFEGGAIFGMVGVEPVDKEDDLEGTAQKVVDAMVGSNKEVGPFEKIDFHGREAVRFRATLDVDGHKMRFDQIVFLRDGFAFRVFTGARPGAPEPPRAAFVAAFEPMDGTVRKRRPRTVDRVGSAYRVEHGAFRSEPYRLAVEPKGRFHVVAGPDLESIDPGALVAIVSDRDEVTVVLVAEHVRACPKGCVDPAAYRRFVEAHALRNLGDQGPRREERVRVAGREAALRVFPSWNVRTESLVGVVFAGDVALQIQARYEPARREEARRALDEALALVRFLDEGELRKEPEDAALRTLTGATYSLRGRTYRDFGRGLVYRIPNGASFDVRAGDDAARREEGAILVIEDAATGVHAALVPEAATDAADLHRSAVARTHGGPIAADPERTSWGEAEARSTTGDYTASGLPYRQEVSTALHGGAGYRLSVWALAPDFEAARPLVDALRRGLSFPRGGLAPVINDAGGYRDVRLGFALRPPAGFAFSDTTDPGHRALGTTLRWSRGAEEVVVSAVGGGGSRGADFAFTVDMVEQQLQQLYPGARYEPATLAGRACKRLRAPLEPVAPRVYVLGAREILYTVVVRAPEAQANAVLASFELPD